MQCYFIFYLHQFYPSVMSILEMSLTVYHCQFLLAVMEVTFQSGMKPHLELTGSNVLIVVSQEMMLNRKHRMA